MVVAGEVGFLQRRNWRNSLGGNVALVVLPPHHSAEYGRHQRKMFLAFRICARPIFSEKGKDIFFWCLPVKIFGQVTGLQFGLGKAEKLFFWVKGFSALLRLLFRPQKGVWGMNAGGSTFRFCPIASDSACG